VVVVAVAVAVAVVVVAVAEVRVVALVVVVVVLPRPRTTPRRMILVAACTALRKHATRQPLMNHQNRQKARKKGPTSPTPVEHRNHRTQPTPTPANLMGGHRNHHMTNHQTRIAALVNHQRPMAAVQTMVHCRSGYMHDKRRRYARAFHGRHRSVLC